jgi:hypothetical protein
MGLPEQRDLFPGLTSTQSLPNPRVAQTSAEAVRVQQDSVAAFDHSQPAQRADTRGALPNIADNADDELHLWERLRNLTDGQFEKVQYDLATNLGLPPDELPSKLKDVATRATDLMQLVVQRPHGLNVLRAALTRHVPHLLSEPAPARDVSQASAVPVIGIERRGSAHRWQGTFSPKETADVCWGAPDRENTYAKRAEIYFDAPWVKSDLLAKAFARLIVHDGASAVHANDADVWMDRLKKDLPGCIGTTSQEAKPLVRPLAPGASTDALGRITCVHDLEADSCELAETMHHAMDEWVLTRLDLMIAGVLAGQAHRLLHYEISEAFFPSMERDWRAWMDVLAKNPPLRRHFLQATLTTADSPASPAALIRLGPKTLPQCVLPATVFALVIRIATGKDTHPDNATRVHNLHHDSDPAHLLGLELVEGWHLHKRFGEIKWPPGYIMLSGTASSADDLIRQSESLAGRNTDVAQVRICDRDRSDIRIFTPDRAYCDAIQDGPEAVAEWAETTLQRQEWYKAMLRSITTPATGVSHRRASEK